MAGKVSVTCPECSANLNVPDNVIGKRIKCPKCQSAFKAEAADDDFENLDDEDEKPAKRPTAGSGRAGGGGKKTSKKGGKGQKSGEGSNAPLIGVSVVGVVIVIAAGLYFSGLFSGKPTPDPAPFAAAATPAAPTTPAAPAAATEAVTSPAPVKVPPPITKPQTPAVPELTPTERALGLRWLPADTDLIVHAKVSDVLKAPLLAGPLSDLGFIEGLKSFQQQLKLELADIESVTFGVCDISDMLATGIAASMSGKPADPSAIKTRFLYVVKTKKPVDIKLVPLENPESRVLESHGHQYAKIDSTPTSPDMGVWFPDQTTIIGGTLAETLVTVERGETSSPRKEFGTIDTSSQVVIAVNVPDLDSDPKLAKMQMLPFYPIVRNALKQNSLKLASIGLTVNGGFDLKISTLSGTSEGAAIIKSGFEANVGLARSFFDVYKKTAPPLIGELGDVVLANLKVDQQDQIVKISTGVPDSAQQKLEQLPAIVMVMAMTGGFGQAGVGGPPMGAGMTSPGATMTIPTTVEFKLPGETEPVEATKSTGLEEGMTMTAKSALSIMPVISANGSPTKTFDLLIDVKGPGIETICGASAIIPKAMTLEGGGTLKKSKPSQPSNTIPSSAFRVFSAAEIAPLEHPPQTLRVKVTVDAPKGDSKVIDAFEGTFRFLTAEETQELTIEDALKKANHPLTEPELKTAKIKLHYSQTKSGAPSLGLMCSSDYFIGRVHGVPDEILSSTTVNKEQTYQQLLSKRENGQFPDDLQINFVLHSQLKEHTVAFRFENVPLPDPQATPAEPTPPAFGKPTPPNSVKQMTPRPGELPPQMGRPKRFGPPR